MSRNREPAEIIRLREAERAFQDAQNSYNQRVKQGEKQLKQAQKAHEKAIESAQSSLEGEKEAFAAPLDSFEGATLYRTWLESGAETLKLDPALGCEVEVTGGGEDAKDTRQVLLHFFSPSGQLDIRAPYEKEKQAHEFANEVTSAARDCIRAKEEYEKNVALLEQGVKETTENTHAIDMAASSLAQDKAATRSVQAAKDYLEKVKAQTPKEMLKTYKRGKAQKKLVAWSVIIILCVIVIALLIIWASGGFR